MTEIPGLGRISSDALPDRPLTAMSAESLRSDLRRNDYETPACRARQAAIRDELGRRGLCPDCRCFRDDPCTCGQGRRRCPSPSHPAAAGRPANPNPDGCEWPEASPRLAYRRGCRCARCRAWILRRIAPGSLG